jgi:localization factor PodJL
MTFGFPWSVKGIRSEARYTAQEAARRAGMPLSDWLNTIILQQAATQGIRTPSLARGSNQTAVDEFADLHQRLDELNRRMDQVARTSTAAYAPKRSREEADRTADLFARLEQRFDQLAADITQPASNTTTRHPSSSSLDNAIAEITARRRSLNGEPVAPLQHPAPQAQQIIAANLPPAHDISGLEDALRRITEQIETLQRPGVEEAIAALRAELSEISRTLNEAMPRRAIETIERQIAGLARRVTEDRQVETDVNVLVGIERGLAEVRDALHELAPAEKLVGYTEAIEALSYKLDLIVAQKDPETIKQLENSIEALREIAMRAASSETMSSLSAQVQALADKIDHLEIGGGGDAFNKLELRIDALSRVIGDRAESGEPISHRLEDLLQSLTDKLEQIPQSRTGQIAFAHLEDRIANLVERLDATDSRLNHLDAIERGLTEILTYVEDVRANQAVAHPAESAQSIELLKEGMARTKDALETVNGSLDKVADRLATIENNILNIRREPAFASTQPIDKTSPEESKAAPAAQIVHRPPFGTALSAPGPMQKQEMSPQFSADFSNLGLRPAQPNAIELEMPADQPLEPGSGPPGSPSVRIAASEAALDGIRPNAPLPNGKTNFIAAARRAAQAAGQESKGRQARPEFSQTRNAESKSLPTKVMTRVKSLFLAASIVAIIVGSIQIASNIFDFGILSTNEAKLSVSSEPDSTNTALDADDANSEPTEALTDSAPVPNAPSLTATGSDLTASLLAPSALSALTPAAPASSIPTPADSGAPALAPSSSLTPAAAPLSGASGSAKPEVTGSIARTPSESAPNRQATPIAQPPAVTDTLPAAIGGVRLRNAALAGDPAAAYEIGMRFVEGRGVPANLEEAARWYERAASKGLVPAQFRYASMLEKGQGVKKDLPTAYKLYVTAAGKGHAKAMHNLAVLYAEGADGKPDYTNAALWFRKAAEHGVPDSQYNLGVLTARGLGTEKSIPESYKWFSLAAAQGDRDAGRKRDEIAAYLNAEALAAAQEAVKTFAPRPQPAEAIAVPQPPGGWDRATAPTQDKPRAARPLSVSAFNSGKL